MLTRMFRDRYHDYFNNAYLIYGEHNLIRHGLRLACGLESQLKGEFQIVRQLERWLKNGELPLPLEDLWHTILATATTIRRETGLTEHTVTIADLILSDLRRHVALNEDTQIAVIGTGKIAQLIAERKPPYVHLLFVARKKRAKAQRLADSVGGEALLPEDIRDRLGTVNAIISATSSPHQVLTYNHLVDVPTIRRNPLYIYDVAVPHDVAPEVRTIPRIVVQDLGELTEGFGERGEDMTERLNRTAELVEKNVIQYRRPSNDRDYSGWYAAQPACNQAG
jgi:glutamyl-tRNA reductase